MAATSRDLPRSAATCCRFCDIVKLASERYRSHAWAFARLRSAFDELHGLGVRLACVTLGAHGALARRGDEVAASAGAGGGTVVDTTGAWADGFVAGLLSRDPLTATPRAGPRFACAIGSRVCTRLGAVAALPRRAEL